MSELAITFPVDGELVNHTHSVKRIPGGYSIPVRGTAAPKAAITVNGVKTVADDDGFFVVPVPFLSTFCDLEATDGMQTVRSRAVCDFDESKRYNFFIDDNVYWLTEAARKGYKSLFESFYLAFLKQMHVKYGVKFTLNTFRRDAVGNFDTQDFPAVYRSEFEDNSDWLRLSFHALCEFPDAPYSRAYPEKLPEHHRAVTEQILRYAGPKTLIEPVIMHFYEIADPASRHYIADCGMSVFTKAESYWNEWKEKLGRMPLAIYNYEFRQLQIPLIFMCNFFHSGKLLNILETAYRQNGRDFINLGTHEQYSYPSYSNYMPDHFERIDSVLRSLTEHGYKPAYFTETLLK